MADCVDSGKARHINPQRSRSPKNARPFESSKYSTRYIALNFAYLGRKYNGLEYHKNDHVPLPTVEEVLWRALVKARLVSPGRLEGARDINAQDVTKTKKLTPEDQVWAGCEYSKCGRTDRGVSAFGQVVSLRVRSARPKDQELDQIDTQAHEHTADGLEEARPSSSPKMEARPFHHIHDELPYVQILNRLLPPDIRILAWCPSPPQGFSARFSCKERRYKYFFTNPCFTPTSPSSTNGPANVAVEREGYLNIPAMQEAAAYFIGLHDFRNFCKLDPSKQLTNYRRRIFHADIAPASACDMPAASLNLPPFAQSPRSSSNPSPLPQHNGVQGHHQPTLYAFTVHGSAFLWHQIRHMISILFLVGQGLEYPSIVPALLDTATNPRRPHYEMADETPLVLWDCIFPNNGVDHPVESQEDGLEWVCVDQEGGAGREGLGGREEEGVGGKEGEAEGEGERVGKGGGKNTGFGAKFKTNGLVPVLWEQWYTRKMDEVLAGSLLNVAMRAGRPEGVAVEKGGLTGVDEGVADGGGDAAHENDIGDAAHHDRSGHENPKTASTTSKLFLGGPAPKHVGKYIPLLLRERIESPEVVNERWRVKQEAKGLSVRAAAVDAGDE